jgi:hypothetical protein
VGEDRWASIKRSKPFLDTKFFPPFDLKEGNLRKLLLEQKDIYAKSPDSPDYIQWKEDLLALIPNLNHDVTVQLALHLAYDAKVNDHDIWRAIEDASVASLHQLTLTQVSQLEWATMELKPKQVSARLNTLLQKRAVEAIDGSPSLVDMLDVLQGFRQRKNKDMYMRIRKQIIARKAAIFPASKNPEEAKKRSENIVNLIYTFASNRPN